MPENWVCAMKIEMQEILPGLFLGPYNAASKCKVGWLVGLSTKFLIFSLQSSDINN